MNWIARTLWDLLAPSTRGPAGRAPRQGRRPRAQPSRNGPGGALRKPPRGAMSADPSCSMTDRYAALVEEMKAAYGIRVRKWRTSMSGCAWEVHYHDGSVVRLIESPTPRGPMSCAVFLHEIGHHAIGFRRYRPRCLEEYHAWQWSLEAMRERGLNVTPAVERRMAESLRYAVAKARRRGLRHVPEELLPFVNGSHANEKRRPPRARSRSRREPLLFGVLAMAAATALSFAQPAPDRPAGAAGFHDAPCAQPDAIVLGETRLAGDVNGDGAVGCEDLVVLLALWGHAGTGADLDGSGLVDFDDLLILLANWRG